MMLTAIAAAGVALKARRPSVRVIGIEPASAALLDGTVTLSEDALA